MKDKKDTRIKLLTAKEERTLEQEKLQANLKLLALEESFARKFVETSDILSETTKSLLPAELAQAEEPKNSIKSETSTTAQSYSH